MRKENIFSPRHVGNHESGRLGKRYGSPKRRLRKLFSFFAIAIFVLIGVKFTHAVDDSQMFGVYTATVNGDNFKAVIVDAQREMTHARVSPDGQWITFTRYNRKGWGRYATESGGYEQTEIMVMKTDGTDLRSVVPPKKKIISANSSWTPDGKGLIYVSNDNPENKGRIHRIDLATGKIEIIQIHPDILAADPHLVKNKLVVSAFNEKGAKQMILWMTDMESGKSKQLTSPPMPRDSKGLKPLPGDFDPRMSPDGTKVVTMRHMGKDNWHLVVVDLASGHEKDLSEADAVDGVAEWSSDSQRLIFWHVNKKELLKSGIYTMKPDGSDRKRIPLPRGHMYVHPSFFPNDGSGHNARVIFSARKEPKL
ncbi:MAG: hypothetical protein OEV28_00290 [Nitrospirota bacterium]|nr:hypothetical protein [Nitrospirota bacterium]